MVFPELRSTENYALKNPAIASDLSQLSLCFFIKLVQDQGDQNVVTYATQQQDNEMVLQIYPTRTDFLLTTSCFGNAAYLFFFKSVGEFLIRATISHDAQNATIGFFLLHS